MPCIEHRKQGERKQERSEAASSFGGVSRLEKFEGEHWRRFHSSAGGSAGAGSLLFPALRAEVAGAACEDEVPDGRVGGLFAGAEEEDAVGREQAVDIGQQGAAGLLRKVEHDVAQKDHVEALEG